VQNAVLDRLAQLMEEVTAREQEDSAEGIGGGSRSFLRLVVQTMSKLPITTEHPDDMLSSGCCHLGVSSGCCNLGCCHLGCCHLRFLSLGCCHLVLSSEVVM
jgi:hypothetical protein